MNIWIVTIGNSDIRLGDKLEGDWQTYYGKKRHLLSKDHHFKPVKLEDDTLHTVPARVLGTILGSELNDKIYNDLHFPLLDVLSNKLQEVNPPDRIIIILTDQNKVYEPKPDKRSPYWKDTCTLKPIVEKYLNNKFPESKVEDVRIEPESKAEGLDNWDKSLNLVRRELSKVEFTSLNDIDNVYVSHQAGTPAISSAIQFVSLVKFGKKVQFLVSNEYEPENTRFIRISNYLRGLKLQEAKILLKRFDYSGVQSLLNGDENHTTEKEKLVQLLNLAVKFNLAKFQTFEEELNISLEIVEVMKTHTKNWWWMGYEAAYLGVVRMEQGNTVEALFHSFRSVEGLICKWAEYKYRDHIENHDQCPKIRVSILDLLPSYCSKKSRLKDTLKKDGLSLYSEALYELLKAEKPECGEENHLMSVVWGTAKNTRDRLFHRLFGLEEQEVFETWGTKNKNEWKTKVLACLNYVADQSFSSLEEVSLLNRVHQELDKALTDYEIRSTLLDS